MPDPPTEPIDTDVVRLETIDLATIGDMRSHPPRRHEDWHPDFPREDDGAGLVEPARGRGLMRSALPALLALAGVRVRGATTRDNAASLDSTRGAGFVVTGESDDEGRQVLLVRPLLLA